MISRLIFSGALAVILVISPPALIAPAAGDDVATANATATANAAANGYPLIELLQRMENHHAPYRIRQINYAISKEDVPIAKSNIMPQIVAGANRSQNSNTGNNNNAGGNNNGGGNDSSGKWTGDLSLNYNLFHLPNWLLVDAAKAQLKVAELDTRAARENLRRDVILAWLEVHRAAEALQLTEARRKTLRARLQRAELRAASGEAIRADVLSALARLSTADAEWQQARHALAVNHDALIHYTGASAAPMRLSVEGELPPLPPLAQWLQQAADGNYAIAAARQNTRYTRHRLQAAEGALAPIVSLSGSLEKEEGTSGARRNLRLSLQQYLYTGGELRAQQRQLISQSDLAHEQVADLLAVTEREIRRLHGQMRADLRRLQSLQEAATAAEALLEVVTIGYDNGINIITEVLAAEEELYNAQLNLREIRYSYIANYTTIHALLAATDDAFAAQIEQYFTPADDTQQQQQ